MQGTCAIRPANKEIGSFFSSVQPRPGSFPVGDNRYNTPLSHTFCGMYWRKVGTGPDTTLPLARLQCLFTLQPLASGETAHPAPPTLLHRPQKDLAFSDGTVTLPVLAEAEIQAPEWYACAPHHTAPHRTARPA